MKRFLALTWKEAALATLFTFFASIILTCLGALVFCIGMYFAGVVSYFSWVHLQKQLYTLYLHRGGEPLPISPKLFNVPPSLPVSGRAGEARTLVDDMLPPISGNQPPTAW
jgi:hypothetical protein